MGPTLGDLVVGLVLGGALGADDGAAVGASVGSVGARVGTFVGADVHASHDTGHMSAIVSGSKMNVSHVTPRLPPTTSNWPQSGASDTGRLQSTKVIRRTLPRALGF